MHLICLPIRSLWCSDICPLLQASFLSAVVALGENENSLSYDTDKDHGHEYQSQSMDVNILNHILLYVKRSEALMER